MKIERVKLGHLRSEEWFQYYTEFNVLVKGQELEKMGIKEQYPNYLLLYGSGEKVLEKIRKSSITAEITQADMRRDTIFSGFRTVVKGMLSHFEPEKQQAASRLMPVFEHYGDLTQKGYSEETASIYNFLQEIKDKYSADVQILQLGEWIKGLETSNGKFSELVLSRNREQSTQVAMDLREVRKQLDSCYLDLIARIEAVMLLNKEHGLEDFVKMLNTNIRRYKTLLAQRQGKAAKKDQQDSGNTGEPVDEEPNV